MADALTRSGKLQGVHPAPRTVLPSTAASFRRGLAAAVRARLVKEAPSKLTSLEGTLPSLTTATPAAAVRRDGLHMCPACA